MKTPKQHNKNTTKREPNYVPGTAHASTVSNVSSILPRRYQSGKYTKDVMKFIGHKRNQNVTFYESGECFIFKNKDGRIKTIRGITSLMARQFYPATAEQVGKPKNKPRKNNKKKNGNKKSKHMEVEGIGSTWDENVHLLMRDTRRRGKTLGKQVHQELSDYANMSDSEWTKKYPRPNMYSVKAIRALATWKLEPVSGEWAIYDEDIPYATAIDMVCVNSRGQLVIVEFKTGYEGTFELPSYVGARLRNPLGNLPGGDCPRNKAMLQITLTRITLMKKYGLRNPLPLVIRIHESGVTHDWIHPMFIEKQEFIYRAFGDKRKPASKLLNGNQQTSKKRTTNERGYSNRRTTSCYSSNVYKQNRPSKYKKRKQMQ